MFALCLQLARFIQSKVWKHSYLLSQLKPLGPLPRVQNRQKLRMAQRRTLPESRPEQPMASNFSPAFGIQRHQQKRDMACVSRKMLQKECIHSHISGANDRVLLHWHSHSCKMFGVPCCGPTVGICLSHRCKEDHHDIGWDHQNLKGNRVDYIWILDRITPRVYNTSMSIRSLERQQLIIDEKRNSQTLKSIDSDIANAQNGPIEDGTRVTMASAGTCTVAKSTKENMAQHNSFGLPTQNALRLASRKMGLGVHKFWYATGPSFPKPYCDYRICTDRCRLFWNVTISWIDHWYDICIFVPNHEVGAVSLSKMHRLETPELSQYVPRDPEKSIPHPPFLDFQLKPHVASSSFEVLPPGKQQKHQVNQVSVMLISSNPRNSLSTTLALASSLGISDLVS